MTGAIEPAEAELFERRFGGLRRLYGVQGAQRVFDAAPARNHRESRQHFRPPAFIDKFKLIGGFRANAQRT